MNFTPGIRCLPDRVIRNYRPENRERIVLRLHLLLATAKVSFQTLFLFSDRKQFERSEKIKMANNNNNDENFRVFFLDRKTFFFWRYVTNYEKERLAK